MKFLERLLGKETPEPAALPNQTDIDKAKTEIKEASNTDVEKFKAVLVILQSLEQSCSDLLRGLDGACTSVEILIAQSAGSDIGPENTAILGTLPVEEGLTPLEAGEKAIINSYLIRHKWNQARTAKDIGIRQNTLIVKMRKYGIKAPVGLRRPGRKPKEHSPREEA